MGEVAVEQSGGSALVLWILFGLVLVALALVLKALWHSRLVQALWIVLLYNFGVRSPSKLRVHQSRRQRRRLLGEVHRQSTLRIQRERKAVTEFLPQARRFLDASPSDRTEYGSGEWILTTVHETGLVEDRSDGGGWIGSASSVSFPLGHHHHVRGTFSQNAGRYVQTPPAPTVIDLGTTTITNKRVVFRGQRQVREYPFNQLLGYEFIEGGACISIAVANRETTTRIRYGLELDAWFSVRFRFALAMYAGDAESFVAASGTRSSTGISGPPSRHQMI